LFAVEWVDVEADGSDVRPVVIGDEPYRDLTALEQAIADGAPAPEVVAVRAPVEDVHDAAEHTLALLQSWLASEPLADAKLVLLTNGALAVADGDSPNLAHAAVAGLVRSAASENPLRFGIVDLDPSDASAARLGEALASDEPELALRD